jgi:glutathione peroxidase
MTTALAFVALVLALGESDSAQDKKPSASPAGIYSFTMETIDGKPQSLSSYRGEVLLIVNVASFCGYTSQYKDLEATYRKYKSKGFRVLAFPANNFGNQEPGTNEEIKEFCSLNYDVSFDLFAKISVKGEDQHPLYRYLTNETRVPGEVKWNFQKYLVNRKGEVVAMFPPKVKPTDKEFTEKLERLLSEAS